MPMHLVSLNISSPPRLLLHWQLRRRDHGQRGNFCQGTCHPGTEICGPGTRTTLDPTSTRLVPGDAASGVSVLVIVPSSPLSSRAFRISELIESGAISGLLQVQLGRIYRHPVTIFNR